MQPGLSEEQIKLNREIVKLKHQLGIKATIACDVHYLKQEDTGTKVIFIGDVGQLESMFRKDDLRDKEDKSEN